MDVTFMIMSLPFLVTWGVPFLILIVYRRRYRAEGKRAPFTSNFFRSPGESLNQQIQEVSEEITINLFSLMVLPLLILPSMFFFGRGNISLLLPGLCILTVFALEGFFGKNLWKLLNKRRALRLGYDGELAVGQELNQLMLDGYRVYHDFQTDKFNIDHIVVGCAGVFAVETKARSKIMGKNRSAGFRVRCDGKSIQFPEYEDSATLQQASRQAKWLRQWLSSAVGDPVPVQPLVALPGWFVERVSSNGIPVVNPKQIKPLIISKGKNNLSKNMIDRIVHQLDQKCRNVESVTVMLEKNK
jgi:hypothetical protein